MAKKDKKTTSAGTAAGAATAGVGGKTVTVKDLAEEFKMDAKELRAVIRGAGFKAPSVDRPAGTFGPKAKYEWPADSEDLKKIRAAVKEYQAAE